MSNYKIYQSQSGSVQDDETGVSVDVDIFVQAPTGYTIDQQTLDDAMERALDYIFDEAIQDE